HQKRYETATAELDTLAEQKRNTESAKSGNMESVTNLKTETAKIRARLESLKDIEKSHEGYQKGTRALLEKKENNLEIAKLMRGSLVDKIKVPPQYEAGVETFLGDRLQALLINSPADAATAIEILRGDDLGRGTFLPMETVDPMPQSVPENNEDVLGLASELVETSEEMRPLMQRLLMNVVFVKDIETALRLRPQNGFTYVTLRGDIVDRSGVISGGSAAKSGVGLLERKRMIDQLTASLAECERRLEVAGNEQERISDNLKELESGLEAKKAAAKEEELALVSEKKEMESLNSELKRHESRLETFRAEAQAMEIEKETLQNDISELEKSIENLAFDKSELEEKLESTRQGHQAAGDELAKLQQAVHAHEVELTSIKHEENMAFAEQQRIEEGMEEIAGRLKRLAEDIASNADRKSELEAEIIRLKDEIHQGLERRENISSQLALITADLVELQSEMAQKEDALKEALGTMDITKESINQARLKESETAVRLSSLIEKAREQGVSREEMENCDITDIKAEEAAARLAELREAIAKIGDVNMTAIEEYNNVDERLTFLTAQRDDLLESINDIKKVIDKLNRTTRSMFEETFVLVRENFRQIFSKLFNGGQADMILTDEKNMLESGIEIYVQPPGKRKQNINLLSAGEKAMTAISILFSVFMVKPSPFCLLDEVDAPLDESNIVRFKDILREYSGNTQFLVITHNQKTMAFADRLYGISMQEPGISKILSVDLVDTDREYTEPLRVVHG
ncbi:MAG: chromosome segregation protein SMC, partial [Nitrospinota bacterium]